MLASSALKSASVPAERVDHIVQDIERGGVLLAVHADRNDLDKIRELLAATRPRELDIVN